MMTYEEIMSQTIYVAKMIGYRTTGTMAEIGYLYDDENCRDFDIVCWEGQPEQLQDFYKAYEAQCLNADGYFFIKDFYNNVWTKQKKVWSEDEIKNLIQTNDTVLYRALKKLYACQTADEKLSQETNHSNGIGFNMYDANILSSIAEFLIRTGFLTTKQKELCRKKLVKYNRQLTNLANAN